MNKKDYIHLLEQELNGIPKTDREELLFDYNEHFEHAMQEGREEDEIANSLGNPKVLGRELRANYRITVAKTDSSLGNVFRAIFATLGLGFFNLVFVLGPFLGLLGVLFGLLVASLSICISGIALIIGGIVQPYFPELINIPTNMLITSLLGVGLLSLGIAFYLIVQSMFKLFIKGTMKYLNMNLKIISTRRGQHENI